MTVHAAPALHPAARPRNLTSVIHACPRRFRSRNFSRAIHTWPRSFNLPFEILQIRHANLNARQNSGLPGINVTINVGNECYTPPVEEKL